jgi:hypothetical protein
MSWEKSVFSSNVQSIGYDDQTQDLIVTWKNGKRSAYAGVPEELADELSRAPSVGTMLNSDIKPNYEHRYV